MKVEEIDASSVCSARDQIELIHHRALQILHELTQAYSERGVGLHFAHLRPSHMKIFELVGISQIVCLSHLSTLQDL